MSTYQTTSGVSLNLTVPALSDAANIVNAFEDFSDSLATEMSSIESNIVPVNTSTGKTTIINSVDGSYASVGRIFVQQGTPANPQIGDIWMW